MEQYLVEVVAGDKKRTITNVWMAGEAMDENLREIDNSDEKIRDC